MLRERERERGGGERGSGGILYTWSTAQNVGGAACSRPNTTNLSLSSSYGIYDSYVVEQRSLSM